MMTGLQWFLTGQVEEEKTSREIVAKFRFLKNGASAMLDLDPDRGSRRRAA
jgi:ferritin